ncbi:MAG: formylmethanofuran dehydrogenase subunit E family protein [Methanoregula sp.]|nr:formylmethanofuran dehydrogenase subunit E family protein [Methanoregula sp.]
MTGKHDDPEGSLKSVMNTHHINPPLQDQIQQLAAFHTYPAPGVLIGAFMVDYALELLKADPSQKLYGVCETPKCLPDALQVIARCTTGNQRLRVIPIGKFAITLNGPSDKDTTEAIRVYVDLKKLKKYSLINTWYANSPAYDKHTMKEKLLDEIFRAGRNILSFEKVRVGVKTKKKWKSVTCPGCGETVPDYMVVDGHCGACGPMKYYEQIS